VGLARASFYRRPADKAQRDAPVVDVLNQIVAKHGRWGFELCFEVDQFFETGSWER